MVDMLKRWSTNVVAVIAWLLVCTVALLIIAVGANLFSLFISMTLQVGRYAPQVLIQTYYVVMGMLWLGFFILMEHLLIDKAAQKGLLLPRTLFVIGIELLIIGLIGLALIFYMHIGLINDLLTAAELVAGAGLIYFFRRKKTKSRELKR
jgi:hypothetical protein